MSQQEAEKRIRKALKTGARSLDLGGMGLSALPKSIRQLTRLQELDLNNNQLSTLPEWIGQLIRLQKLDLRSNQLSAVPESIGQLAGLKVLDLQDNQLSALPESIGQLAGLQELDFRSNQLSALPEWIGQLTGLRRLNLSHNKLSAVPESIGQLAGLQQLYLSGNQLSALPEWIGKLTGLQGLGLSDNQLSALPEWIGELTGLRELYLHGIQLSALPEWIGQLTGLRTLNLSGNQLSALPESIGQLAGLQQLYLYGNQLRALPESIGQLAGLKMLILGKNKLNVLPESIGKLTDLQWLDLRDNQLSALPKSIGKLADLNWLDLRDNQLSALPESIGQLTRLTEIYLHGNPDLALSPNVLGPTWDEVINGPQKPADPQAILAFYFGQRKQSAKPLNEVKLLLVGHGRVGKTSLSKALRGVGHDEREPETPGIERHPLELTAGRSRITAHVWDFGGQEFLHQTHQFFFSERSIYVVVLMGREGRPTHEPMQEAEYWLRLIRTYGTGSPVVIALNKIKAHPFSVDRHYLEEKYPEVKAVVETDCDPRVGIEALRAKLGRLAAGMPSVREKIDPGWARVRTRLEEMPESFVTFEKYCEICAGQGVRAPDEQQNLATILNCLGIALNYRDDPRLREKSVLKPRWLVDGIYTVLRWLHKHKTNGIMRIADLPKALKPKKIYPATMHGYLVALMQKFELCFPVEDEEGTYLAPGLLDENQPRELKKFMGGEARKIQFRYEDVRPPGLLPRFIVRSHTLSEGQARWRRGVVLARGKARALVRGDHEGRVIDVFALGKKQEDRVWLTEFILAEMRVLNDKLPVRTFVESEAQPGAWTELELLHDAARGDEATRTERLAGGGTVKVNVKKTLREVESAEASAPGDRPMPLFICYAHDNEREVKGLIPSLKVLARRGHIAPWRDTDLVPGEDWDETVQERLAEARVILYMVSREFLASEYITREERPLAMRLAAKGKAVVVPILLEKCAWQDEDFSRFENLPAKGRAVSSYSPRSNAWVLVEEGLMKAVGRVKAMERGGTLGDFQRSGPLD